MSFKPIFLLLFVSTSALFCEQTIFLSSDLLQRLHNPSLLDEKTTWQKPFFLFDLHDVLFMRNGAKSYIKAMAPIKHKFKCITQALKAAASPSVWRGYKKLKKDKNKITEAYFAQVKKYPALYKGLCSYANHIYTPNTTMYNFLKQLTVEQHELYLLSNIGPDCFKELKNQHPNYFKLFKLPFNTINKDSQPTGTWVCKPYVQAYQQALATIQKTDTSWLAVFVDDKQKNVDGAVAAGLNAILFKNPDQFIKDATTLINLFTNCNKCYNFYKDTYNSYKQSLNGLIQVCSNSQN